MVAGGADDSRRSSMFRSCRPNSKLMAGTASASCAALQVQLELMEKGEARLLANKSPDESITNHCLDKLLR